MQSLIETAFALQRSGAFELLLPLLLKATLIALIGRLLIMAVPRASAATRYLVALTTLAALLLLPILTIALPSWRLAILPAENVGPALQPAPVQVTAAELAPQPSLAKALPSEAPKVLRAAAVVADSGARAASILAALRASWRGWFVIAVIAIGLALVARLGVGIAGIWWVTRRGSEIEDETLLTELDRACDRLGVTQLVRVLTSEHVDVPLVWGLRKPVLLLPAHAIGWTRERLRVVFLHELAHLRRRDAVTLLITRSAAAIWWFHPVVWSLDRTARRDCEQACDDLVLGAGTLPSDYADHLLSIARLLPHRDPFGAVTLAMSRRSQLEGRLLSILQPHVRRASTSRNAALVAAALALLLVIPLASMQLTAAPAGAPTGEAKVIKRDAPSPSPSATVTVNASREGDEGDDDETNDLEDSKDQDDFHGFIGDVAMHLGHGWYERGNKYLSQRQYEKAIAAYEKAIETDDKPAKAAYNAACAYALQNDRDHALEWLEKAVELGYADADHYIEDSDLDPLRSDPRFQRIIERMSHSRRGDQRLQQAMTHDDRLRARGTATSHEWAESGANLLRLRELTRAVDALNRSVQIDPANTNAWHNLACAYALAGDRPHALDALEKSVTLGSNSAEQIKKDPDLASLRAERRYLAIIDMARSLDLNSGKHWMNGWLGDDEENWSQVAKHFEDLTRQHPEMGRAWFNLGFARLKANDPRGAVAAFQKSVDIGYRPATSTYNIGCAQAVAGNTDAALRALQAALDRGMDLSGNLEGDDDLDSLRHDPRFEALVEKARAKHEAAEKD